jgi:hypothetical protein
MSYEEEQLPAWLMEMCFTWDFPDDGFSDDEDADDKDKEQSKGTTAKNDQQGQTEGEKDNEFNLVTPIEAAVVVPSKNLWPNRSVCIC